MKFVVIFLLSIGLAYFYRLFAIKHDIVDTPNHRSSHQDIVPRGGGVVFISLWLCTVLLFLFTKETSHTIAFSIIFPVSLVAMVSFIDDYYDIPRILRLFIHLIGSAFAVFMILGYEYSDILIINAFVFGALILTITWSINLFNFMDGLDGFAAIQAIFIFSVSGLLLYKHHDIQLGYLSLLLVFAVMGFLFWNWPKAKIFMGDVGSTSLGLLIMIFASWAYQRNSLSPIIYLILYLPFLFDATITMLRRMLYGEKWYHAHKSHAYQRLHSAGWPHQKVLIWFIGLNMLNAILALLVFTFPNFEGLVLCAEFLLIMVIYFNIEKLYPMRPKIKPSLV